MIHIFTKIILKMNKIITLLHQPWPLPLMTPVPSNVNPVMLKRWNHIIAHPPQLLLLGAKRFPIICKHFIFTSLLICNNWCQINYKTYKFCTLIWIFLDWQGPLNFNGRKKNVCPFGTTSVGFSSLALHNASNAFKIAFWLKNKITNWD